MKNYDQSALNRKMWSGTSHHTYRYSTWDNVIRNFQLHLSLLYKRKCDQKFPATFIATLCDNACVTSHVMPQTPDKCLGESPPSWLVVETHVEFSNTSLQLKHGITTENCTAQAHRLPLKLSTHPRVCEGFSISNRRVNLILMPQIWQMNRRNGDKKSTCIWS